VLTLGLQGGPRRGEEIAAFESRRFFREAIRVRQWDDQGKVGGFQAPGLDRYVDLIESVRAPPNAAAK
jgi:predicted HD phosphohydrolase